MKLDSVFRCSRCQKCLSSWYFEKNGELFCKQDYWTLYGDSCNRCGLIITGPVMVRGGILHAWDHLRRRGLQARVAGRSSARTLNQLRQLLVTVFMQVQTVHQQNLQFSACSCIVQTCIHLQLRNQQVFYLYIFKR